MGTTLTGTTPQDTYDSLIKVTDNGPLSATVKYLSDGLGNDSALALSTGNIGIGTNAPTFKFQVNSAASATAMFRSSDVGTVVGIDNSAADGDPQLKFFINDIGTFTLGVDDSDSDKFKIGTSDLTTNTRLTIDSTGLIGIGTATPAYNLHVNAASDSRIIITDSAQGSTANDGTYIRQAGVNSSIVNQENGTLQFGTNNSFVQTILANGNVGIGTSSPNHKLDVNGVVGGFQAGQTAYKTYSKLEGFQISAYQSVNGAPYTKTTDVVANADSGVASELRVLVAASGSNPAEVARFTSNGLTFNGDTAAANALDDYEEGTWTMGITFGGAAVGVTYGFTAGTYTKIGRQVTVNGYLQLSSKGSSTGAAKITGLPFTIPNNTSNYSAPSLFLENVTFTDNSLMIGGLNTTTLEFYQVLSTTGTVTALTNTNFSNNSGAIISFTYFV